MVKHLMVECRSNEGEKKKSTTHQTIREYHVCQSENVILLFLYNIEIALNIMTQTKYIIVISLLFIIT